MQLKDIRKKTLNNVRYVVTETIQDINEAAQTPQLGKTRGNPTFEEGKIPVAEADLINSQVARLDGTTVGAGETAYLAAAAGFEIGMRMEFEWTQEYALRIEEGWSGIRADGSEYNVPGRRYLGANLERASDFLKIHIKEVNR